MATIAEQYAKALQDKLNAHRTITIGERTTELPPYIIEVEQGAKYARLVQSQEGWGSRHVHAFVTADGKLVKAGSWKAPQKDRTGALAVRFDLADPEQFALAIEKADYAGGYLYAGR